MSMDSNGHLHGGDGRYTEKAKVAPANTTLAVLPDVSREGLTREFGTRLLEEYPDVVFVDVETYHDATVEHFRLRLWDREGNDITPRGPEFDEFNARTDTEFFTEDEKRLFMKKNARYVEPIIDDGRDWQIGATLRMYRLRVPGSAEPAPPKPLSAEAAKWANPGPVPASSMLLLDDDEPAPF